MIPFEELEKLRASFPCIFFRLRSSECALCRYGKGLPIKEAIRNTICSVSRGLEKRQELFPNLELVDPDKVLDIISEKYIKSGSENITDEVFCFGLLRTDQGYVCATQDLWIRSTYRELIPYLFEVTGDTNGCLCYIASMLVHQEDIRDLEVCED